LLSASLAFFPNKKIFEKLLNTHIATRKPNTTFVILRQKLYLRIKFTKYDQIASLITLATKGTAPDHINTLFKNQAIIKANLSLLKIDPLFL
jgi:hypothetical protein